MCNAWIELDDTDIFDEWIPKADCGWQGQPQEDTLEGQRDAEMDADHHESYCEK